MSNFYEMNQEQPRQYSEEEIRKMDEMRERVVKLGKDDAGGEDSVYDLAKKEDAFRSSLSPDSFSTETLEKMETGKRLERTQRRLTETEEKSLTDPLTGLGNRRALKEIALAILKVEKRRLPGGIKEKRNPVHSLIILDLDFFKKINDTYGHPVGDTALKSVAEAMRKAIREEGSAYRYGGEEFAVFLPHTNSEAAEKVAERIRESIENLEIESEDGRKINITASIGYSTTEQIPEETIGEELLNIMTANSDNAMYFSKGTGKNKVTAYDSNMEKKK